METSSDLPQEIFLKEVHHRMKNHMATLVGLFTLQSAQSVDERVRSALTEASSRAASMMVLYDRLYQQQHLDRLEVTQYLPALVREVVRLFSCCHDVEVETRVANVVVSARQAQPLTLLVNEIVTNAVKHAFLTHEAPRLDVDFSVHEGQCLLKISDNGVGANVAASERENTGFGMDLIEILVHQLKGTLHITTESGTTVMVRFPPDLM